MAALFFAQAPEVVAAKLDLPVETGTESTGPALHLLVVGHLNTLDRLGEVELGALGRLARATTAGQDKAWCTTAPRARPGLHPTRPGAPPRHTAEPLRARS